MDSTGGIEVNIKFLKQVSACLPDFIGILVKGGVFSGSNRNIFFSYIQMICQLGLSSHRIYAEFFEFEKDGLSTGRSLI